MALDLGILAGLGLGSLDFQNEYPKSDLSLFIHLFTVDIFEGVILFSQQWWGASLSIVGASLCIVGCSTASLVSLP